MALCTLLYRYIVLKLLFSGNFKDGVRMGKFGPVGSDKRSMNEIKHNAKQYKKVTRDRFISKQIHMLAPLVGFGIMLIVQLSRDKKPFRSTFEIVPDYNIQNTFN